MTLVWRLGEDSDFPLIQTTFECAGPSEPTALDAQRLVRTFFPKALKNTNQWDWRPLVGDGGTEAGPDLVAVGIHRAAPDWLSPLGGPSVFSPDTYLRLLVVAAVITTERSHGTTPRLADGLMEQLIDDARRRSPADRSALLVGRVHKENGASQRLVSRHGFVEVPALAEGDYLCFGRRLATGQRATS